MSTVYEIVITDAEHWGDRWADPAPFSIEAIAHDWDAMPNAPMMVVFPANVTPDRAARLLREVAGALERNGDKWLPKLERQADYTLGDGVPF